MKTFILFKHPLDFMFGDTIMELVVASCDISKLPELINLAAAKLHEHRVKYDSSTKMEIYSVSEHKVIYTCYYSRKPVIVFVPEVVPGFTTIQNRKVKHELILIENFDPEYEHYNINNNEQGITKS